MIYYGYDIFHPGETESLEEKVMHFIESIMPYRRRIRKSRITICYTR